MTTRQALFALRVVRRREGDAGVLYRRSLDEQHRERLTRITSISPLAFTAGTSLLRAAVQDSEGAGARLTTGPFHPLNPDWGARVACYALVASGLRNGDRVSKAAAALQQADGTEAAWWFGILSGAHRRRAVRALRILVEAVK